MTQFNPGRSSGGISPEGIQTQIDRLVKIVDQQITFGHPHHPRDLSLNYPAGTALSGDEANQHNGTLDNILGSWVEVILESNSRQSYVCTHNLNLKSPTYTVPSAGEPNVRWFEFGELHDGTGTDGTSKPILHIVHVSDAGSPVTANAITLSFQVTYAAGTGTIDATHPYRVSLFFIPAVQRQ